MRKPDGRNGSDRASRVGPGFQPSAKEIQQMVARLCKAMPRSQVASMTGGTPSLIRKIELGFSVTGLMASKSIWLVYCLTFDRAKLDTPLSIASWGELQEPPGN